MTARRPKRYVRKAAPKAARSSLKVSIRGKDDAPLSIAQLQQGIYELARKLEPYGRDCRVKRSAMYLTIVDRNGEEVSLSLTGEWTIWPYRSAADELDAQKAWADALATGTPNSRHPDEGSSR
jgi:hypothetical protein